MSELLLVEATEEIQSLASSLEAAGFHVRACRLPEAAGHLSDGDLVDILLISLVNEPEPAAVRDLLRTDRLSPRSAILGIVRPEQITGMDPTLSLDDFVVLPASSEELIARIRLAIRGRADDETSDQIHCGDLTIDQSSYKAFIGNRSIELTYKEYELLRFLALNQDKVCTREMLLSRVWGYDFYGGGRTVDVHIRRLRSKIEGRGHTFIQTVRNVGYRFHAS